MNVLDLLQLFFNDPLSLFQSDMVPMKKLLRGRRTLTLRKFSCGFLAGCLGGVLAVNNVKNPPKTCRYLKKLKDPLLHFKLFMRVFGGLPSVFNNLTKSIRVFGGFITAHFLYSATHILYQDVSVGQQISSDQLFTPRAQLSPVSAMRVHRRHDKFALDQSA